MQRAGDESGRQEMETGASGGAKLPWSERTRRQSLGLRIPAQSTRQTPARRGQLRLLAHHFLWRFLDNDLISPEGDVHETGALVLTFLAVPGLLATGLLIFKYSNPWITAAERMLIALDDKATYLLWSMVSMALVTLIDWDALSLDARDYAILGPLPISPRTLLLGKLAGLALFIGTVAAAANLIPTVFFPFALLTASSASISVPGFLLLIIAHGVACLLAAIFGFFAVLALRGVLLNLLGSRIFRRISVFVQFAVGLVILVAAWGFSIPRSAITERAQAVYASPLMWFLGLYETLAAPALTRVTGPMSEWQVPVKTAARTTYEGYLPVFHQLAWCALAAFAIAALVGLALYFAGHFRSSAEHRQQSATEPGRHRRRLAPAVARLARRTVVRDPVGQASFFWTLEVLGRSARHRLYLAGYLAVACLLAYGTLAPVLLKHATLPRSPSLAFLSIQYVIAFFLLAGLRFAFTMPAELRANWLFRMTTVGQVNRLVGGVRRAVWAAALVPFFLASAFVHAALWGLPTALLHAGIGLLWALVLFEALLGTLRKLPFTCPHVGQGNLKTRWPLYVVAYLLCTTGFARAEQWAAQTPRRTPALVLTLAVAFSLLFVRGSLLRRRAPEFVFEEAPEPAALALGLGN
jgi:hypothetical protein